MWMTVGCQSYKVIAPPSSRMVRTALHLVPAPYKSHTRPFPAVLPRFKPNLLLRRLMAKGPATQTEETFGNYALGQPPPSMLTPFPEWQCLKGWAALAVQPGAPVALWKHVERALAIAQQYLVVTSSSSSE